MQAPAPGVLILIVAVSAATATLVLTLAAWILARRARKARAELLQAEACAAIAFLFDDELLVDATGQAQAMLDFSTSAGSDWKRLSALLRHRFPGIDSLPGNLVEGHGRRIRAMDGSDTTLCVKADGGRLRVVLEEPPDAPDPATITAYYHQMAAIEAELRNLRALMRAGPVAVWRQDAEGAVLWANEVYFDLAAKVSDPGTAFAWPPPAIFRLPSAELANARTTPIRASLRMQGRAGSRWFECHGQTDGDQILCFALPADSLVHAEVALREFVQTLSKTFADLPIGLAIFDRARQLALFNPALTDLTGLSAEFLASRPTLFAFLDRLRDLRRIPEPRDYASWRQRMSELETGAAGGFVQEDWNLPTGQTFRVTGRPHPEGAVAFLIQDISAEISLTRRFRAEVELGQAVADSLDQAVVAFSAAGTLNFSNAAYARLWGVDPGTTLIQIDIAEAIALWKSRCAAGVDWDELHGFVTGAGERREWSVDLHLTDGPRLCCRLQPVTGGTTLVSFASLPGTADPGDVQHAKAATAQPGNQATPADKQESGDPPPERQPEPRGR